MAIDALIGEEEQNGKQERTKRKKQGAGSQPRYPGPFRRLLRRAVSEMGIEGALSKIVFN